MASWTQKKQMLAIGGGAALVCALAVGGVFYANGLIEEINASTEQKRQEIAAAEVKAAAVKGLEQKVVVLRENLREYVKILPDSKELNDFVRMVHQFQRQSGIVGTGLVLKNGKVGKTTERFSLIEYSFDMTATLWEFLKFVNLVENYDRFVNIAEWSITSGDSGKQEDLRDGEVVHSVRLTLQTYTYNGKPGGKEVVIRDYDGLVESLREEIFKLTQTLKLEKYQHKGNQLRRDILVDPRLRGDGAGTGTSAAEQRAVLERYVAEAKTLRDMEARMRRPDTTMFEQFALEKRVREGLAKLKEGMEQDASKVSYGPYRVRWGNEVVTVVEALGKALDDGGRPDPQKPTDPFLPLPELQQLVAQLEADCTSGQLEAAKERYDTVASRLAIPTEDPRHALAVAAKAWQVKATTALDFRSLDLKLQGVVVNHGGKSAVLLNGAAYEEGEYVSEDLLVKQVEEEQVWFVFRGLTLVRTR